uniref:Neuropeptide-Like Protein n=1 Tax=Parastrongyloides trichosuri TaxID=131310 RepID=A0A0N5A7D5_PARTI
MAINNMKLFTIFVIAIIFTSSILSFAKDIRSRPTSFDRFYKRAFDSIDNGGFGAFDKRSGGMSDYSGSYENQDIQSLLPHYFILRGRK